MGLGSLFSYRKLVISKNKFLQIMYFGSIIIDFEKIFLKNSHTYIEVYFDPVL